MTPEKRLNQLEPLVAEISAQLDRVTAQNRQLVVAVSQIAETIVTQSDNSQFLLREVADLKADVTDLKADVTDLKADVTDLKADVNTRFNEMNVKFDGVNAKVDLILQILQSGNGRH